MTEIEKKFIKAKFIIKNRKTKTDERQDIEGIITQKHDIKKSFELVMSNIYAKRCVDELVETICGKGFSKADDEIKKLINPEMIKRVGKDFEKCGNGFIEVVMFEGKIVELWHVPAQTMNVSKKIKTSEYKTFVQSGEDNIFFDEFTSHVWDEKAVIDGNKKSYILHLMNYEDDSHYGTPAWIAVKIKLKQCNYSDEFIDSFFEDDAIPQGVLLTKGAELDDEAENNIKDNFENGFKGSRNRRGLLHLHMDESSSVEYLTFNENIINNSFLNLQRENKVDICAAFGVPPKKIGLETPGRLGGGNDFEQQLKSYYEDVIIPKQEYFESKLKLLFPGKEIELKRPVLKTNKPADNSISKKKHIIHDLLNLREELLNDE